MEGWEKMDGDRGEVKRVRGKSGRWQWQREVLKTVQRHHLARISVDTPAMWLYLVECMLLTSRFTVRVGIRFSVWLVGGYASLFKLLSVVIVTFPMKTGKLTGADWIFVSIFSAFYWSWLQPSLTRCETHRHHDLVCLIRPFCPSVLWRCWFGYEAWGLKTSLPRSLQSWTMDTGPFLKTQSNPIQFGCSQVRPTSNPIHKYLVLNRTRQLCASNYSNGDF